MWVLARMPATSYRFWLKKKKKNSKNKIVQKAEKRQQDVHLCNFQKSHTGLPTRFLSSHFLTNLEAIAFSLSLSLFHSLSLPP